MLHAANINLKQPIFVGYYKWVVSGVGISQNTELFGTCWLALSLSIKAYYSLVQ
jgi:hypothetical protein